MEESWTCIYRSGEAFKIELFHGLLEEENIVSVVINKQDSAYHIGDVELYVKQEDVLKASRIIKEE